VVFEDKKAVREPVKPRQVIDKKVDFSFAKPKRSPEDAAKDQQSLKDAKHLFEQEIYQEAALIYTQLDVNIDFDALHSYYFGVCLFHSKKDKVHCAKLLDFASSGKNIPVDVFYYLGRANHLNYKFAAALAAYQKYISLAKPADIKKFDVEKEIEHCNSGLKLVNNPVVIEVFEKKHVALESIHIAFTHLESGAKILMITDDLRSSVDKKKNFKSEMYLSPDKNTIFYTSYGENEENGKDIYRLKKVAGNKWSPVPLNISTINTPLDEEYPFLSPDGKTLYFSSKGHENMGGYDLFKSIWNEETQTWSAPVNLGSPINSPNDDIYFVE